MNTGYGSDDNVAHAENRGVDLQSPVPGAPKQDPDDLTIDDFVVDEETQTVERCPDGHEPVSSVHDHDQGRTRTVMAASYCSPCPHRDECPVKKTRDGYVIEHTPAEHRTTGRRTEQATDAFRENYAIRGGGESVNSGLKRKTGMGRLRVRGSPRIRMAVLLRCAGWNPFRALAAMKRRGIAGVGVFFGDGSLIRTLVCRMIRAYPETLESHRRDAGATRALGWALSRPDAFRRLDRRNIAREPESRVLAGGVR